MRKAKAEPSFMQYFGALAADQPLTQVLTGHLVVEAVLVELIQLKHPGDAAWRWSFPEKVKRCVDDGLLPVNYAPLYLRLNDMRNDFAHILGHRLTYDELFQFVREMASAGFDFSDDTVHGDRKLSEQWYGFDGCMLEILNNLYLELAWILRESGGPDRC